MPDLPARPSDAGPLGRDDCPCCGSIRWHTLSYCQKCGDPRCNHCATTTDRGLICASCVVAVVSEYHQEDWPEMLSIADVERCGRIAEACGPPGKLVTAQVRYPNIPEWDQPGTGWVM